MTAYEVTPAGRVTYAAHVAHRARQLHQAGWPVTTIAKLLADEFNLPQAPKHNTVHGWVDPDWYEARRARERMWHRGKSYNFTVAQNGMRSPEWKTGRMQRLRDKGLSYQAISKVMAVDFPNDPVLGVKAIEYRLEQAKEAA